MLLSKVENNISPREEWQNFVEYDKRPALVSKNILSSWERSKKYGIDPYDGRASIILPREKLSIILQKSENLIKVVKNYTDKIYNVIEGLGYVIFLTDYEGNLIYIEGDKAVAEDFSKNISFRVGASWSEQSVGTTAVSMVLDLESPVSFMSEDKYCLELKKRACSAVPIKDANGSILGVLGIAADSPRANEEIFGMLIIAGIAVENHIKMINTAEEIDIMGRYYKSILDSVSDGIISIDKRGIIININKSAEKILLIDSKHAIGKHVNEVLEFGNEIVKALKPGQSHRNNEFIAGCNKNGTSYGVKNSIHIIQKNGEIGGIIDILSQTGKDKKTAEKNIRDNLKITFDCIIGKSKEMQEVKRQAVIAASSPASILINGESGTGKELFAQSVHNAGNRSEGPFVAVNCGAIPRELIESEFFGYEDGAFTGAKQGGRPGKFELASGGTIFLDEIGEMPSDMQIRLLRVLQQKEVVRIGGIKNIPIDVKVIAATNKDLLREIDKGSFRQDLYWRINVITIDIPPLCRREGDIPLLSEYFINKYNEKNQCLYKLHNSTLKILIDYYWPGNVRELENALLRAITFAKNYTILPEDLPKYIFERPSAIKSSQQVFSLEDTERSTIEKCLQESRGNIYKTAKVLGISRNTLYCKLKKYNIEYLHR